MGSKYFPYSAKDNNCQDFILSIFRSNNLSTKEREDFIKQDTKKLFTPKSRKLANTITDIAGKARTLIGGGHKKSNDEYIGMDTAKMKKEIMDIIEKHEKFMQGSGLAGELAKLTLKDAVSKKSKGEKSFFELSNKDKAKQFKMAGKVLENAPYKISGALERTKKKVFGKGVDAVSFLS